MNYRALHDTVEAALVGRDDVSLESLLRPHKDAFLDLFKEYKARAHPPSLCGCLFSCIDLLSNQSHRNCNRLIKQLVLLKLDLNSSYHNDRSRANSDIPSVDGAPGGLLFRPCCPLALNHTMVVNRLTNIRQKVVKDPMRGSM